MSAVADRFTVTGLSDCRAVVEDLLSQGVTRDVIVLRIRPEVEPIYREFAQRVAALPWLDACPDYDGMELRFNNCRVFVDQALGEEYVVYGEAPGGRFSYVSVSPSKPSGGSCE